MFYYSTELCQSNNIPAYFRGHSEFRKDVGCVLFIPYLLLLQTEMSFIRCLNESSERIQESKKYFIPTNNLFYFSFPTRYSTHLTDTFNFLKPSVSIKCDPNLLASPPSQPVAHYFLHTHHTQSSNELPMHSNILWGLKKLSMCQGLFCGATDTTDSWAQVPILKGSLRQLLIYVPCFPTSMLPQWLIPLPQLEYLNSMLLERGGHI